MIRALVRDRSASSAAEFGLVLPLLLLLMFGILDAGRLLWDVNRAEKATQMGARAAAVTDVLAPGLANESYVGKTVNGVALTQGDVIPAGALGEISCTNAGCSCTAQPCPADLGTFNSAAFNLIVQRMALFNPYITSSNVRILYRGSGLGFAGDPNGMEIAPFVTVELSGLQFRPITLLAFTTFPLPSFTSTLTAEDSSGSASN